MKRRSLGWTFKRRETWYIGYFVDEVKDGRKVRKKVRVAVGPKKSDATAKLAEELRKLDDGKWTHPTKPLTFDDLLALIKNDWRNNGRKSSLTTVSGKEDQAKVKHLRAAFGRADVQDITAVRLATYANDRQDAGAAVSSVRNELNILKHAMRLAHRYGQLATLPAFPTLTPTNVRTGFFERADLDAILAELPEQVCPVITFMYWTGWRHGEALSREWRHVDLKAGVVRLEPGETKNGKGRDFPYGLVPELAAVIERQREYTDDVERRTGQIVPFVFHREGRRIKSFRSAWVLASRRSGIARIPHDFRRTAVRNLVRAGVSEKVAMELTGHLTRSVFERYNITNDRDRRDAVGKLAAAAQDRSVLPLKRKAGAR